MFQKMIPVLSALALLSAPAMADWNPIKTAKEIGGKVSDASKDAQKQAEKAKEDAAKDLQKAREKALAEAAKIDELRKRAEDTIRNYQKMKADAERAYTDYQKYQKLLNGDSAELRQQAFKELIKAGAMGSNRKQVDKDLEKGLTILIRGKEIDHFEEYKFASAVALSVSSGNTGPAMVYLKGFALESKQEFMKNLKNVKADVRKKLEHEFEKLLIDSIDKALKHGKPLDFAFHGVSMKVGLATYNHWVKIQYNWPELVPTEKVLGIQLYMIRTPKKEMHVPLPNTFVPYFRVTVNYTAK